MLSERWIAQSRGLLKRMEELSSKEKMDRLEITNSMNLALRALERSIHGWLSWSGNLQLMSRFTLEELAEMDAALRKQVRAFIEYDIEITERHKDKMPRPRIVVGRRERGREEARGMYV